MLLTHATSGATTRWWLDLAAVLLSGVLTEVSTVASMAPARNDPCPCGSGKKFKRCCLEAHVPPTVAPNGDARSLALASADILMVGDHARLPAILERVGALMVRGGPLEGIRLDWRQVEEAVRGVDLHDSSGEATEKVLRTVLTRRFVEKAKRATFDALAGEGLSPGDLEAIAVAHTMLDLTLADRRHPLEVNPVLKVLLRVQAAERTQARDAFWQRTRELGVALRDRPMTAGLDLPHDEMNELVELVEADDELRTRLEKATDVLQEQTLKRLQSADAPQGVLTVEEHLWVLLHMSDALEKLPDDSKQVAPLVVEALDKALDDEFDDTI